MQVLVITIGNSLIVSTAGTLTHSIDIDVTAGDAMPEILHIIHTEGKDRIVADMEPGVSIPATDIGTLVGGILFVSCDGDIAIMPYV